MACDQIAEYRQWILAYALEGCEILEAADGGIVIRSDVATGAVAFYDIGGTTVVELRLERATDAEPLFFLHFEFDDLDHAEELFEEMAAVLRKRLSRQEHHVLLCCTCGMTTTFFANKLNELSRERELGYDFCAKSVEEAKRTGAQYEAVLLAPQVGHELKSVREALPGVLVIEIPGAVYGSYDASSALTILEEAQDRARKTAENDLRFARDFDNSKSVLGVCFVYRADEPTISYVALENGRETLRGRLIRSVFDIDGGLRFLLSTLKVSGYTPASFDAIGIAIPSRGGYEDDPKRRDEQSRRLSEQMGVPVFVDTTALAASAGCYVSQNEWDDVVFHAQPIGAIRCEQGYIFDGKPRVGLNGFAGNMHFLARLFSLSADVEEAAWRYEGIRELVAHYLVATICAIAPQAIFVWCDFLPHMDDVRKELLRFLPEESIPELVSVSSYDKLALMGELSLCLQRLV